MFFFNQFVANGYEKEDYQGFWETNNDWQEKLSDADFLKAKTKSEEVWEGLGWNYMIEVTRRNFNISHFEAWNMNYYHMLYINSMRNKL